MFLNSRMHFQISQWSSSPSYATDTSKLTHLKWHGFLLPSYSTSSNSIRPSSLQKAPSFMFTPNSAINPGTTSHWHYMLKSSQICPIFSIPTAGAWIHPQKPPNYSPTSRPFSFQALWWPHKNTHPETPIPSTISALHHPWGKVLSSLEFGVRLLQMARAASFLMFILQSSQNKLPTGPQVQFPHMSMLL